MVPRALQQETVAQEIRRGLLLPLPFMLKEVLEAVWAPTELVVQLLLHPQLEIPFTEEVMVWLVFRLTIQVQEAEAQDQEGWVVQAQQQQEEPERLRGEEMVQTD